MGFFYTNCVIQNLANPRKQVQVKKVMIDSGSEYSWIPADELYRAGIQVRKKDLAFIMANGEHITRDVGHAIIQCNGFETVDEVVFGKPGDLRLLGAHTLEGFGAVVDARRKKLVQAGPAPAAAIVRFLALACVGCQSSRLEVEGSLK
jgi:predicted aspartyl protease